VWVPGYLLGALDPLSLGSDPQAAVDAWVARADVVGKLRADGEMQAELRTTEPVLARRIAVGAGDWRVEVEPAGAAVEASVGPAAGGGVDLRVRVRDAAPTALRGVWLRRLD
jgi:hypothetical protein